jgi:hypothetical protein
MTAVPCVTAVIVVAGVTVVLAVTRVTGGVPVLTVDGVTGVTIGSCAHGLTVRGPVILRHRVAAVLGLRRHRRRTVMFTVPAGTPLVLDHRDSFRPEPTSPNRIPPGGI